MRKGGRKASCENERDCGREDCVSGLEATKSSRFPFMKKSILKEREGGGEGDGGGGPRRPD